MASGTPSLNPPLVTVGSARLLVHENAIGAVISGFKTARPDLFLVGSFNVPDPKPPINLPKPGGGASVLDYRFEITDFGFDISPADQVINGFADPFTLSSQQVAVYLGVAIDLAGSIPQKWSERLVLMIWVNAQLNAIQDDALTFSILDARVALDQVNNVALLSIFSHLLVDFLSTTIGALKIPIKFPMGQLGTIAATAVTLGLDALDVQAVLS
jgi:hypothetical protein